MTAYQMLHRHAILKPGDTILVHGASGGVGTALLQLGKILGLTMFGTASESKHPFISALDATPIDYRNSDFVKEIHARYAELYILSSLIRLMAYKLKPDGKRAVFYSIAVIQLLAKKLFNRLSSNASHCRKRGPLTSYLKRETVSEKYC